MKIGINGLGRIGRCIIRVLASYPERYKNLELVAVNGPADPSVHRHLIKYDSVHGVLETEVELTESGMSVGDLQFDVYSEREPGNISWEKKGVQLVLECTGKFNSKSGVIPHMNSGCVKKVIISAPAKDVDATIVYGVNHDTITSSSDIISASSCTTNCLAPVISALHEQFKVSSAFVTTVHSYTSDQNLLDGSHTDLRRARAAALSIIPTTTGATKTIEKVIPDLKGKILGSAIRVPTANVSMIDLCFTSEKTISHPSEIHDIIIQASEKSSGVLGYSSDPLVSCDFIRSKYSSVVDFCETAVLENGISRVVAWYDNEWAFAMRMLDIALLLCKHVDG